MLTQQQVEAATSGLALDVLVAEHVMGFRRAKSARGWTQLGGKHPTILLPGEDFEETLRQGAESFQPLGEEEFFDARVATANVPRFSTSLAAAWLVVEALAGRGLWLKLHTPFTPGDLYWCSFDQHGCTDSNPLFSAGASGPEVAICKAALLTTIL